MAASERTFVSAMERRKQPRMDQQSHLMSNLNGKTQGNKGDLGLWSERKGEHVTGEAAESARDKKIQESLRLESHPPPFPPSLLSRLPWSRAVESTYSTLG